MALRVNVGALSFGKRPPQRFNRVQVDRGQRERVSLPPRHHRRQKQGDRHPTRRPRQSTRRSVSTDAEPAPTRSSSVETIRPVCRRNRPRCHCPRRRRACPDSGPWPPRRAARTRRSPTLGTRSPSEARPPLPDGSTGYVLAETRIDDDGRLIHPVTKGLLEQRLGLLEQ